jgi:hypothetical protein
MVTRLERNTRPRIDSAIAKSSPSSGPATRTPTAAAEAAMKSLLRVKR